MFYRVKDRHNKVTIENFNRREAIIFICQNCPHYIGPAAQAAPSNPVTEKITLCSNTACKLHQFQPGTEGQPQHTAPLRERALRFFCDSCKRTNPSKLAKYEDIVCCPERTCAAFPFRLVNQVDVSVKIEDPTIIAAVSSPAEPDPINEPLNDAMPIEEPMEEVTISLDEYLQQFEPVFKDVDCGVSEQYVIR